MRQCNGERREIPWWHIFLCMRISRAVVRTYLHPLLPMWNCMYKIGKHAPCVQVHLTLHVWFQSFVACEFKSYLILESRQNSGYSLNHQHWIICSRLHQGIAVNFSTLLKQIQCSISLIIHWLHDCLCDIELMYCILGHGLHIPGLAEEHSPLFPCSEMNVRHTTNPLCCRGWWSQIWHRMFILFTSQFWQSATQF
jgi:hypothetical protein